MEDLAEGVTIETALYDTTLDLNNKTLEGYIHNYNANSTMTLLNGTITSSDYIIIENSGTMYIKSGTYTGTIKFLLNNFDNGVMYITGGTFNHVTSDTEGVALVNNSTGTSYLSIKNADVNSNVYAISNWGTGTIIVDNSTITKTAYDGIGITNMSSGTINVYNSVITVYDTTANSGEVAVTNYNNSGTLILFDSTVTGEIGGMVFSFLHVYNWNNMDLVQIGIYNLTITDCQTWTSQNGQDDLVNYSTYSATTSVNQNYLYTNIIYSNHNSTTDTYYTEFYNESYLWKSISWYWNFDH